MVACFCLGIWVVGPAAGFGVALHKLEHDELDQASLSGMSQVLIHGHLHDAGEDHHRHEAVPPSPATSQLAGERQLALVCTSGIVAGALASDCLQRSGAPPIPVSLGPPGPPSLSVLRL